MIRPPLTGLVLAGGSGRRMGTDKALLEIDGVPLIERVTARIAPVCTELIVASGDGRRLPGRAWRQVADEITDGGPLGGIAAGLAATETDLVAVVAVDLPLADPEVLTALAARHTGGSVVLPEVDGRLQPLHAVWAGAALPELRRMLQAGERAVLRAIEQLDATVVPAADLPGDGRFATNVNRPGDLDRIR